MTKKQDSFTADAELVEWLRKHAEKTKRTRSSIVQEALEDYRKKVQRRKR